MTSLYEVMLLLRTESEVYQKSLETVRTKVKELSGSIEKETPVGDQVLAYPIAKQKKGHYHLMNANLDTTKVKALDAELKLVDGLLRFLIVSK